MRFYGVRSALFIILGRSEYRGPEDLPVRYGPVFLLNRAMASHASTMPQNDLGRAFGALHLLVSPGLVWGIQGDSLPDYS